MERGQIPGKETNQNLKREIEEMFLLRASLSLEINKLSRISLRLEEEQQEEIRLKVFMEGRK